MEIPLNLVDKVCYETSGNKINDVVLIQLYICSYVRTYTKASVQFLQA